MLALMIDWMGGGPFLAILLTGIVIGAGLIWAVAGMRTLDAEQAHRDAIRALQRIYIGVNTGWTALLAADEAGRALHLDRRQETTHG